MGDTGSGRCGYTGSPNHNLGATDPQAPVNVEPWLGLEFGLGLLLGLVWC